jgi:phosphatidylinositol alpha 1,6-mannosyltransferase
LQTTLNSPPRIALFPDTYEEANGVATLSRQMVKFARERDLPMLLVRGGNETRWSRDGSVETLELKRGLASFAVDKGLYCDPFLVRFKQLVVGHLREFKPDLVHITGPGDIGFLGLWTSHIAGVPLVGSWHTNLHEYLSRRLDRRLRRAPKKFRAYVAAKTEQLALRGLMRFYRTTRFVWAPNQEMVELLRERTGKPAFLMPHGVDLEAFHPLPETIDEERPFRIGYVGRLTTEKNIRVFADMERALTGAGERNFEFLIVGEGGQGSWLRKHLRKAEFAGILRGSELAAAYRRMDAFVFPSSTDTFGLVILEALASGVPVILPPETGARAGVPDGLAGMLTDDFVGGVRRLMHDEAERRSMGRAARRFASGYSWAAVFEHLYETYDEGLTGIDLERAEKEAAAEI